MLIGIHGWLGSGKDTFAKMFILADRVVNYGSNPFSTTESIDKYFTSKLKEPSFPYSEQWSIKKFADPLKDITCILLGCTREQLEDRDFKDSKLREQWSNPRYKQNFPIPHYPTVREFMQQVGTNCLREFLHENVFINAIFNDYKALSTDNINPLLSDVADYSYAEFPKWILTDMRFPN